VPDAGKAAGKMPASQQSSLRSLIAAIVKNRGKAHCGTIISYDFLEFSGTIPCAALRW
jgi:hypothetical protein